MRKFIDRWWNGLEAAIAVDIHGAGLTVAWRYSRSHATWNVPLPARDLASIVSGRVEGVALVSSSIEERVREVCPRYMRLAVALPSQSILVAQYLGDPTEMTTGVDRAREWASETLSLSAGDYIVRAIPLAKSEGSARASIVAVRREPVELWQGVAQSLNFELALVAPRSCALHRACSASRAISSPNSILVEATSNSLYLHRFEDERLVFSSLVEDEFHLESFLAAVDKERRGATPETLCHQDVTIRCSHSDGCLPAEIARQLGIDMNRTDRIEWMNEEALATRGLLMWLEG